VVEKTTHPRKKDSMKRWERNTADGRGQRGRRSSKFRSEELRKLERKSARRGWVKTERIRWPRRRTINARRGEASPARRERSSVAGALLRLRYGEGSTGTAQQKDQFEMSAPSGNSRSSGGGAGYSSWVHLDDAAKRQVLGGGAEGERRFNIVDDGPAQDSEWRPLFWPRARGEADSAGPQMLGPGLMAGGKRA